jgi:hypothetical protein
MTENKSPLIMQTSRFYYIFLLLVIVLIPAIGITFFLNFANDPTVPSPIIPPLVGATFIIIGIIMGLLIFLKMKHKLTIDGQQLEITTYRNLTTFPWEIATSLEVIFTGKIQISSDIGEAIFTALLSSNPAGGVKITITSATSTDSINFMQIQLSEVKKLIEKVNSITKIEATEKRARMKRSIWNWKFQ